MLATVTVNNLLDIDELASSFLKEHKNGIITLHKIYFKTDSHISLRALIAELQEEIKDGCVTFINKGSDLDELDNYLFYIANAFCKKRAIPIQKKKTEYLCPGCLFLGKDNVIPLAPVFKCDLCFYELKTEKDPKNQSLYRTFATHNKIGYHCGDCKRFIPHPMDNTDTVSCPYFDCCFVGEHASLKKMHHPTLQSNPEKLILDISKSNLSMKDNILSNEIDILSQMEIEENLQLKIKMLKEVIETQYNNVPYSSSDFTVKHKLFTYQAFDILLSKYPEEMVDYLLNSSRSGGFQHKVFQEYTKLLEAALPFYIKRNGKPFKIEHLLDSNMCVFDGISIFEGIVNSKLEIKNNTQEFYIGGRKASYTKPYYIGKLLSVIDQASKTPLLDKVVEYSFSKIKMKDIDPNTKVTVTHLRIPPHYQMGGMVYVNRVRKKIVDRAQAVLNKDSNV